MAQLIYSMVTSLDGYVETADGALDVGVDGSDAEVHSFVNDLFRPVGTYLYGRRMYETMVYWETVLDGEEAVPAHVAQYARDWQAARKIVVSTTLAEPASARTEILRGFDPDAVRSLKETSTSDVTVDGPTLAAHAIRAGLVDEYRLFVTPRVVGGGKRFFPDGADLDLELLEQRRFDSGIVYLRYRSR